MLTKKNDYWSASQLNKFLFCPLAYYEIYFKGAERIPPNAYMIYGTAIHHALAENFKQKIDTKKDLPLLTVLIEFKSKFYDELKKYSLNYAPEFLERFMLEAENSLEVYLRAVACNIQPRLVEYEFKIKLTNFPITIMGYIDLITEDDIVIDLKTVGKSWRARYTKYKIDNDIQLTLYSAAFRKLFKREEKELRFDVMPRNEAKIYLKSTSRTQQQVIEILTLASNMEKIIKLGVFIPNYNSCNMCPFKEGCLKQPIINK